MRLTQKVGLIIWAENIYLKIGAVLFGVRNAGLIPKFKYTNAEGSGEGKDEASQVLLSEKLSVWKS